MSANQVSQLRGHLVGPPQLQPHPGALLRRGQPQLLQPGGLAGEQLALHAPEGGTPPLPTGTADQLDGLLGMAVGGGPTALGKQLLEEVPVEGGRADLDQYPGDRVTIAVPTPPLPSDRRRVAT